MSRRTSPKRRRILYLTWHIRKGLRVSELTEYLESMGYDDHGIKLPKFGPGY